MKKILLFIACLAVVAVACGFSGSSGSMSKSERSALPLPAMSAPLRVATVNAAVGVWLRTRPDSYGPSESVGKGVLGSGSRFVVENCVVANGQSWTFGHPEGSGSHGYVASVWLTGGCELTATTAARQEK